MRLDPCGQLCGTLSGHAENGIFHHVAVVGNIVAGEHGKRRQATLAAAMKRFDQNTRCGMRFRRMLEIVQDAAVLHIQFSRRRIDAVAFFGNGEGDNCHLWFAELLNNGCQRVEFGVKALFYRTDNNGLIAFGTFLQHGKQMILRPELAHKDIAAKEANLTNSPVASSGIQYPVC